MTYTNITVLEYVANPAAYENMTVTYDNVEVTHVDRIEGTDEFTLMGVEFFPQNIFATVSAAELLTVEPKVSEFDEALRTELLEMVARLNTAHEAIERGKYDPFDFIDASGDLIQFVSDHATAIRFVKQDNTDAHSS